jgi:hypothetical protein
MTDSIPTLRLASPNELAETLAFALRHEGRKLVAQCDYIARHGGGTFAAWGSPAYVSGAMTGAAISNAVRVRADFRDCMEAKGWRLQTVRATKSSG